LVFVYLQYTLRINMQVPPCPVTSFSNFVADFKHRNNGSKFIFRECVCWIWWANFF